MVEKPRHVPRRLVYEDNDKTTKQYHTMMIADIYTHLSSHQSPQLANCATFV